MPLMEMPRIVAEVLCLFQPPLRFGPLPPRDRRLSGLAEAPAVALPVSWRLPRWVILHEEIITPHEEINSRVCLSFFGQLDSSRKIRPPILASSVLEEFFE
jgi:hypothetical protein